MGVKNVGVVRIEEDANCISKMARTIDKVRKKATSSMGRPPPRERGTPVKAIRKAKVTAPAVVSFKFFTKNQALSCQKSRKTSTNTHVVL